MYNLQNIFYYIYKTHTLYIHKVQIFKHFRKSSPQLGHRINPFVIINISIIQKLH